MIGIAISNSLGLNNLPRINPAAQAFLTAAGITGTTQIDAINALVNGLQADGLWSKMKAIYPFVGGTASTHKWNLKDPRDLDAAFRLVFNGGWTHSSNGAQGNGTNGWADTKLQTNTNLSETSTTLSIYSRTNNTQLTHDIGARNFGYTNPLGILSNYNTVTYNVWGDYLSTTTGVNTSAYFIQTKNSTTAKLFRNTTNILTATKTLSALPTTNVIIGAAQDSSPGVYVAFSNRQYAFAHIGDGLTDTEAANLYSRVNTFQTALSRNV